MNMELIRAEGLKLKRLCRLIPFFQGIILISMTALEWYLYFRQGPGGVYAGFAVMYMFISFVFFIGHYDSCQHNGRYGARNEGLEAAAGHADPQRIDLSGEFAVDFHFAAVHRGDYGRGHVHHLVFIYERTAAVENPDLTAAFRLLVFPADDGDPAVVFHRVFQSGAAAGYRNIRLHFQPVFGPKPFFHHSSSSLVISRFIQSAYSRSCTVDMDIARRGIVVVRPGSFHVRQKRV